MTRTSAAVGERTCSARSAGAGELQPAPTCSGRARTHLGDPGHHGDRPHRCGHPLQRSDQPAAHAGSARHRHGDRLSRSARGSGSNAAGTRAGAPTSSTATCTGALARFDLLQSRGTKLASIAVPGDPGSCHLTGIVNAQQASNGVFVVPIVLGVIFLEHGGRVAREEPSEAPGAPTTPRSRRRLRRQHVELGAAGPRAAPPSQRADAARSSVASGRRTEAADTGGARAGRAACAACTAPRSPRMLRSCTQSRRATCDSTRLLGLTHSKHGGDDAETPGLALCLAAGRTVGSGPLYPAFRGVRGTDGAPGHS